MKIKADTVINRLNGKPLMTDQGLLLVDGRPVIVGGQPQVTGGRPLTVGDVLSSILSNKKMDAFNALKAFALAQRFYKSNVTDVDDGDFAGLRHMIEEAMEKELFAPLVLAQVEQCLIDAKEKAKK